MRRFLGLSTLLSSCVTPTHYYLTTQMDRAQCQRMTKQPDQVVESLCQGSGWMQVNDQALKGNVFYFLGDSGLELCQAIVQEMQVKGIRPEHTDLYLRKRLPCQRHP